MKKLTLILLLPITIASSYGQALDWAKQFVGSGNLFCRSMAIDHSGNVYTTGSFDDTLFADTDTGYFPLASMGNKDIYISKRGPNGDLEWIHSFGTYDNDAGLSIGVDSIGNVFFSGYFSGTIDFDPGPGVSNLTPDQWSNGIFICKFDPAGNLLWAKQPASSNVYFVTSMSVSKKGNICLFGSFIDTVDFDPDSSVVQLYSTQWDNMFVAKYNSAGHLRWVKNLESAGNNEPSAVYIDTDENVYITGSITDSTDFDSGNNKYILSSTNYSEDIFIEKLDSSGNFLWVSQLQGPEDGTANDITVDQNGNVYTTGSFAGKVDFDPGPDSSFLATDSIQNTDVFISKLDSSGQFLWAKRLGSFPYLEVGYSIAVDNIGNIYTTGIFNRTSDLQPGSDSIYISVGILQWEDIYLNKLDSHGNFLWTKQIGGDGKTFSSDLAIGPNNQLYITGSFAGELDFDMSTSGYDLLNMVAWDGFVAKLDPSQIGLTETPAIDIISLYPNPFETWITFDLTHESNDIDLTINDMNGRTVFKEHYSRTDKITLHPNIGQGIYLASITTDSNATYYFKVVKK